MTANSIEESEALTLDFNKRRKLPRFPAYCPVQPTFRTYPCWFLQVSHRCLGNYVPCSNTAEVLNSDLLNCAVPDGWT